MTSFIPPAEEPPLTPLREQFQWWRLAVLVAAILLAGVVYLLLPAEMNPLARRMVVIFIIAAIFWASEVIPLYATSLLIVGLQILMLASDGGLAATGIGPIDEQTQQPRELSFQTFLRPFASPVIMLFLGGFLLSAAVTRHGLDKAIASRLLHPFTRGPLLLIYGIMAITAFFSMWMSNTATSAMMIAIILPLLRGLGQTTRYNLAIVLAVPLGANIGGIGTPIGTPPNAVALAALRDAGIDITFLQWMMIGVPLAVLLMAVAGLLLYLLMKPPKNAALPDVRSYETIPWRGKLTLVILVLAILGWLTSGLHGVADAVVALTAAAALTALAVLKREDVDSIDWNILILMWGGLSLGQGMEQTGLVDYLVSLPLFAEASGFILSLVIVVFAVGLSTFMSNTAAANLIIPMVIAMPKADPLQGVILTAFACSFAMALPISTPPNAIAFASGQLPARTLVRIGSLVSIISIVTLLAGYQLMLPLILGQ